MRPAPEITTPSLVGLAPGTHLCSFSESNEERARIATTFVAGGLAAGDQLLYVADDDAAAAALLSALPDDVGGSQALASGQLQVRTFAQAYGAEPDLDEIAAGFRAAARQSRKDGFAHLRVAAEMSGLTPLLGSAEAVLGWERRSTRLQREIGVTSVCQYDRRRLGRDEADRLASVHDGLAPDRGKPPAARILALTEPWGLSIAGEVDLANRDVLIRAIRSRVEVSPRVHLDLRHLTFADVGTVSSLHDLAAALPPDGWLVLRQAPALLRRVLDLTGLGHKRLVVEP